MIDENSESIIQKYKLRQHPLIVHPGLRLEYPKYHFNCETTGTVGILPHFISNLYFFKGNCENVYLDFTDRKRLYGNNNPLDLIFDQKLTNDYHEVYIQGTVLYDYGSIVLEDIRKATQSFFKFRDELMKKINYICIEKNINEKTLGVHIRMNDWNSIHGGDYGYVYYEDYTREIDDILNNNDINNIFVGSDNYVTLEKLKNRYGNKFVFIEGILRRPDEHIGDRPGDDRAVMLRHYYEAIANIDLYISSYMDLLLLTKCGYFIGRKYSFFHLM